MQRQDVRQSNFTIVQVIHRHGDDCKSFQGYVPTWDPAEIMHLVEPWLEEKRKATECPYSDLEHGPCSMFMSHISRDYFETDQHLLDKVEDITAGMFADEKRFNVPASNAPVILPGQLQFRFRVHHHDCMNDGHISVETTSASSALEAYRNVEPWLEWMIDNFECNPQQCQLFDPEVILTPQKNDAQSPSAFAVARLVCKKGDSAYDEAPTLFQQMEDQLGEFLAQKDWMNLPLARERKEV